MTLPSSVHGMTTQTICLIRADVRVTSDWLASELSSSSTYFALSHSSLAQVAELLVPGVSSSRAKALLAWNDWTLMLTGGPLGTDPGLIPSRAAGRLGVLAISATANPGPDNEATALEVFDPEVTTNGCLRRSIAVVRESSWRFHEWGERFPFEQPEFYDERSKRERFTPVLLDDYLTFLGAPRDLRDIDPKRTYLHTSG
jgi:hypothetical protein